MSVDTWGYVDPASQARMVLDRLRVDAYARAISQVVKPGDVVLDVGSGSGVLALLAAKAGARKVYAVEVSGAVELVRAHAEENGVADIVQVIHADIADIDALPEPPRVVVSEMLGHFAPSEGQHRAFARALAIARDDAVLIPRSYRIAMAPASPGYFEDARVGLGNVSGVSLGTLRDRLLARVSFLRVETDELLGTEGVTDPIDLVAPLPTEFRATTTVDRSGEVTAIAAAFVATLADGIDITTAPTQPATHWLHAAFPLDPPLAVDAGDNIDMVIRPRIVTHRGTWTWGARCGEQTRSGDAMRSFIGDQNDMLAQLGFQRRTAGELIESRTLDAWAAAVGGRVDGDIDQMSARLLDAHPTHFANHAEARQEVLALLQAANALS